MKLHETTPSAEHVTAFAKALYHPQRRSNLFEATRTATLLLLKGDRDAAHGRLTELPVHQQDLVKDLWEKGKHVN